MATNIVTKYVGPEGAKGSRILAKGAGKQRTVNYDDALSSERNHGLAAGTLAQALGLPWSDNIVHLSSQDGCKHTFSWV